MCRNFCKLRKTMRGEGDCPIYGPRFVGRKIGAIPEAIQLWA
jgi:hypothetical protein